MNNRIFAIDIGTNSIHGIIASIDENGNFKELFRAKDSIRLGEHIENGYINQKGINLTISVLKNFKKNADLFSAKIKAVATSAVREAINRNDFINKVKSETGIEIEVISGESEGKLIYKGVTRGLDIKSEKVMIIDIGGGSTEIILGENDNIFVQSLNLGAIRTSLKFFNNYNTSVESIFNCKKFIIEMLRCIKKNFNTSQINKFIGTSGTIQAIARVTLIKSGFETNSFVNNLILNINDLNYSFDIILSKHSPLERYEINGLDSSRAEIISAGSLILKCFLEEFLIKNLIISTYSLREGIIFDTFEKNNKII